MIKLPIPQYELKQLKIIVYFYIMKKNHLIMKISKIYRTDNNNISGNHVFVFS